MSINASYSRRHQQGFTLLEILVVVGIMSIVTTYAVLAVAPTDKDRLLKQQATQLVTDLKLFRQLAIVKQQPYGLITTEQGYEFVYHQQGAWHTVPKGDFYQPSARWHQTTLTKIEPSPNSTNNTNDMLPDNMTALISVFGTISPFLLHLNGISKSLTISADNNSNITVGNIYD